MMNPAEFSNIARAEDSLWWYTGMHDIALRMLKSALGRCPTRILEAGCGTGGFGARLRREYDCPVHLSDVSHEGLRFARARGLRGLLEADVRALPVADGSCDCVLSFDVLVYFEGGAEEQAMAELARVLRPGGLLMIRVAALEALRSRHSVFTREKTRFTRGRLIRIARRSGLEVLRCTYLNSLLLPIAFFRFRIQEPLLRKEPASGVEPIPGWLNAALGFVLKIEGLWLAAGGNFPLGQSLLLVARKPA